MLDENINWLLRHIIDYKRSFLVIDEAHNLQNAYSSINSNRITIGTVEKAIKEMKIFLLKTKSINEFLSLMLFYFKNLLKSIKEDAEFNIKDCIAYCSKSFDDFIEIVEEIHKYGVAVRQKLNNGKAPRSSLFHLSNFWNSAIENLNEDDNSIYSIKNQTKKQGGFSY
ncbi:MAG: hypothetical protein QW723_03210 [Candidatus Bathyarchaeia archaeon]